MVKMRIHNMMFYGFHGVYEYEREQGQKFYIDAELCFDGGKAMETDDAADDIEAATIYSMIKDVVENKRFHLLEALAANLGDRILEAYPRVEEVTLRVRKPSVPISGPLEYVEIEVTRKQK